MFSRSVLDEATSAAALGIAQKYHAPYITQIKQARLVRTSPDFGFKAGVSGCYMAEMISTGEVARLDSQSSNRKQSARG